MDNGLELLLKMPKNQNILRMENNNKNREKIQLTYKDN